MNIHSMMSGQGSRQSQYKPFFREGSSVDLAAVKKQIKPENTLFTYLSQTRATLESDGEAVGANIRFLNRKLASCPPNIRSAVLIDARVMHGNPVIAGTRVPVYQIIEELADGTAIQELPDCFPGVTTEKIQAGLDFAIRLLRVYDDQVSR
jgi:uncharacterized protein (DUF433 family)